jgi:translation initiation factor IF-2
MPTYEVARGDTVWALTRRALTAQLGRAPTNREILEVVRQVQVPSGDVNLIRPGEQVTIPVGPAYGRPSTGESDDPTLSQPAGPRRPSPSAPTPGAAPSPGPAPGAPAPAPAPAAPSPAPGSPAPAPAPAPGTPPAPARVPGWESIEDEALQAMLDNRPVAPSMWSNPFAYNPEDYRGINSFGDFGQLVGQSVRDALPLIPISRVSNATRFVPNFLRRPALPGPRPALGAGTPPPPPGLPGPRPALGAGTPPPPGGWPGPMPPRGPAPRRVRGGETPTRRMDYDDLMDYDDFDAFLR